MSLTNDLSCLTTCVSSLATPRTLAVLGGAIDTGNLGVSALGLSAAQGLRGAFPRLRLVFQSWSGRSTLTLPLAGECLEAHAVYIHASESLRARSGTRHVALLHRITRGMPRRLADMLQRTNQTLSRLLTCDAILDVSAGDSLADIYGPLEFEHQVQAKLLAIELGKPLVLLPQTFGPFSHERSIELMRKVVGASALVATREVGGIDELRSLCGGKLPHDRFVCVPDMAFILEPSPVPEAQLPAVVRAGDGPLIGLNVSGMLYLSKRSHGLREPYPQLIEQLLDWAVERCGGRVLLVPHVIPKVPPEQDPTLTQQQGDVTDTIACNRILQSLPPRLAGRVGCLPWPLGPRETKYFAGLCDFFIGARMHACIGAISQCVPTVTLAYSKKAFGVMSHLDCGQTVLDLRDLEIGRCTESIDRLYRERACLQVALRQAVPAAQSRVRRFFTDDLAAALAQFPSKS